MTKRTDILTTYFTHDDYIIAIREIDGEFQAWLQHKDYGIIDFMYGASTSDFTFFDFIDLVETCLDDYIIDYEGKFIDITIH